MSRIFFFFTVIVAGCFQSCGKKPVEAELSPYFENVEFFELETARLTKENIGYTKTLEINGKTDHLRSISVNWNEELAVFKSVILNKPAYGGKFKVDKTEFQDTLIEQYTSLDSKIPVKDFRITRVKNVPTVLEYTMDENSLIFTNTTHLKYVPQQGYEISGTHSMKGFSPESFNVSVRFLP